MPVPTETHRSIPRLNMWFAISSVILTVSTVWLVMVDYNRPWKVHQAQYMDNQASIAQLDYLTTQRETFQDRLTRGRAEVSALRQDVDPQKNATYGEVLSKLNDLKDEAYGLELDFKQKDALIVVARNEYEHVVALHGPEAPVTQEVHATLTADEAARRQSLVKKQTVDDQIAALDRERKDIEKPYETALRELNALEKEISDARTRRERFSAMLYRGGLNIPLLDFVAPPGTPARFEVKQVVAQDVKTKLNFLDGYKVDRCVTCHVVIDDPNYSQERLVAQFEAFIPAIAEHLARDGGPSAPVVEPVDPPTVFGFKAEQLRGQVASHWADVPADQRQAYFEALQEQVNAYLRYADMPTIDLRQPLQAHPNLNLFLSADSPHPIKELGCTVCHEGNGQETDFVLAAHTPKSKAERAAWSEKYYDRNLGIPTMTWHVLDHYWDFPMIPPQYSEAGCAKCHTAIDDIAAFDGQSYGEKINHGETLFLQTGCINCHLVADLADSRMVGPDLTHVASKLDDGFLHNWIFNPIAYRPSTRMPHFFMQENNGPGSENSWDPNPVVRTRTETLAMTAYLKQVSTPWTAAPLPTGIKGNVENGQALFAQVGCLACHGNIAEYGERWITDDLVHAMQVSDRSAQGTEHAQKLAALNDRIKHPDGHGLTEDDVKRLTIEYATLLQQAPPAERSEDAYRKDAERQVAAMDLNAQTRYAMRAFTETRRADAEAQAGQEELVAAIERRDVDPLKTYIPPVFTRFGPDLSGIGSKVDAKWLYTWLQDPRHYSSYTKMPRLRLTPQEGMDLTAYLMTLQHDHFDTAAFEVDSDVVAELDHRIEDLLSGQNSAATIERLQKDDGGVLTSMLEDLVGTLPADATLTDKKMIFVGHKSIAHYGCFACHSIKGFEATPRPGTELTAWGEKNIHQLDFAFFGGAYEESLAHSPQFSTRYPEDRTDLVAWAAVPDDKNPTVDVQHTHASFATNKLLNPRIWDREKIKKPLEKLKMPNYYFTPEEAEALTTYLMSRRPPRVADSLQIPYAQSAAGPIAAGRQLVQELNCVGCHRIEDNVAAMHQFITAQAAADEDDDWDDWDDEEDDGGEEEPAEPVDTGLARLGAGYGGAYDEVNGPPWLRGQGAKVQPGWMHDFLLNVETLRPWEALRVRMPSFYLTSEQASQLVDYFGHLAIDESEALDRHLRLVNDAVHKEADVASASDRWHTLPTARDTARVLRDYAVENRLLPKRNLDFSRKTEEEQNAVYGDVLAGATFFRTLYDIDYPFAESDFQWMDSETFARGERLFQELQCLSCHVLGDPLAPGSNLNPSAPNLNLTHKRLRYEWFHQWLQQPGKIQPGTKMPQWFPGGRSAYGQYSDDLRQPFEDAYGATGAEQMRLLLDYVWQAGLINHTATTGQPAAGQPQPAAPAEEESLDQEDTSASAEMGGAFSRGVGR